LNILVIKLRHLGDVLVTTPVLTALKETYPGSKITMLVNQGTEEMVLHNPALDEIITLERDDRRPLWRELLYQKALLSGLRQKGFSLSLDLSQGDRGAIISWLTGAPERIGYRPKRKKQCWWTRAYTQTLPPPPVDRHMVSHYLEVLSRFNLRSSDPRLKFFWTAEDQEAVKNLLAHKGLSEGKAYVVLHPTSRWMFKCWRSDGYARLVDYIRETLGWEVIITSGPEEKERRAVREILARTESNPLDLSGELNIKQLGCLIAQAQFFLGVDSAPMHIAAAVGTPVVVLFGPSGEVMWGPWEVDHQVIKKDWDCRPCGRDGCQGSKISKCLVEITTDEVISGIRTLLNLSPVPLPADHGSLP